MTICAISDLHGILPEIEEEWELVLICGDISPLDIQGNHPKMDEWMKTTFAEWVNSLPCKKVVMVAGNHDLTFQNRSSKWLLDCIINPTNNKLVYLENNYYDYLSDDAKVYRIYGTPDCHKFGSWAFMYEDETIAEHLRDMPENCDILISHDAPYGTSDVCFESFWNSEAHLGSIPLRDAILRTKPDYCFHGHLHSSNHDFELLGETKIINCSIVDESYSFSYPILYLTIY